MAVMTALPGRDERPAGSSQTRQEANPRRPVSPSPEALCTSLTTVSAIIQTETIAHVLQMPRDTLITGFLILGCWCMHRVTWGLWWCGGIIFRDHGIKGGVLGWRKVSLPTYEFRRSLVYLECQFALLSNGVHMPLQQIVKDKMRIPSNCRCQYVCTHTSAWTQIYFISTYFLIIFKYCFLIKMFNIIWHFVVIAV